MNLLPYIFFVGLTLIFIAVTLYKQKKQTPFSDKAVSEETVSGEAFSETISNEYTSRILDFITYFETLPLKESARRFMLTATTFEIMLYHEELGGLFQKYQRQTEEKTFSSASLQRKYLYQLEKYLGEKDGLQQFQALSAEIKLSDHDPATPALFIRLYTHSHAQREHYIQEIAAQYQQLYHKPFPQKIFNAPDPPPKNS